MYSTIRKGALKLFHFGSKHMWIFSALGVLVLLLIFSYRVWNASSITPMSFTTAYQAEPLAYTCCTPLNQPIRTKIFYLKLHKTGSSTVQSIILRFAMMNKLDVMCVRYDKYFAPLTNASFTLNTMTPNNKYHIFAHHLRYDSKLRSYQYPDTPMVTTLRHPATLFQSMYVFFRMNETTGMTFEQFLKAPLKPQKVTGYADFYGYRGYNQMSVDLGFDPDQSKNTTAIELFIEKIDRDFDLVMISEHMDVSLVLLANLMGWPIDYMVHVNLNARPKEPNSYKMTQQDIATLMELNNVDTLLYHHFLKKFQKCVRQYGEDELNERADQLNVINKQFQERCVAKEFVGGLYFGYLKAIEYVPKNHFDLECVYSTQLIPPLSMVAASEQAKRLKPWWFW